MTADAFTRPSAVLNHSGGISSGHGYHILSQQGGLAQEQAYAITTTASAESAGAAGMQAYGILTNPAAVPADNGYAVSRHDVALMNLKGYVVMTTFYPPYEDLNITRPFSENQFPTSVSYGSSGGPGFKTSVFTVDSGVAHAHAEWDRLRARFDVQIDHYPREDIEKVEDFFYAMRGSAIGFRYKDWSDYQIVNQNVVIGDGKSKSFQLFKRYRSGGQFFDRMIRKPVRNQIGTLMLDGVEMILNRDFYFNYTTGAITFNEAPAAGAVGHLDYAEFDIPVRFDTDELVVSAEDFNQFSISSLSLIEILV